MENVVRQTFWRQIGGASVIVSTGAIDLGDLYDPSHLLILRRAAQTHRLVEVLDGLSESEFVKMLGDALRGRDLR